MRWPSRITSFIERHDFILIVQMRGGIVRTMRASGHLFMDTNAGEEKRFWGNTGSVEFIHLRISSYKIFSGECTIPGMNIKQHSLTATFS
jgi:hypothetical protein